MCVCMCDTHSPYRADMIALFGVFIYLFIIFLLSLRYQMCVCVFSAVCHGVSLFVSDVFVC